MSGIDIGILVIALIVLFFSVYAFSQDDFMFVRKNINLNVIFDTLFLVFFSSLIFARIVFVLFHFNPRFLNPLVFFVVVYFPGLSLVGGLLGGILATVAICTSSKIPTGRFLDILSMSFLASYSLGFYPLWLSFTAIKGKFQIPYVFAFVAYILLFLFIKYVFVKVLLKEGSITALFIFVFGLLYSIFILLDKTIKNIVFLESEGVILITLIIFSLVYFLRSEKLLKKLAFLKKK